MPAGRPSKFEEDMAAEAFELMSQGYSKTAVAGALGIARDTFYRWCDEHAEFSDAISRGVPARVFKLEKDLLEAEQGPKVTSRIFALKNAAPDEWRDKHEHDVKGSLEILMTGDDVNL